MNRQPETEKRGTLRAKLTLSFFLQSLFAASLWGMTQQTAESATSIEAHGDSVTTVASECMETGSESFENCKAPLPPCPFHTKVTAAGPLVMLPNGVCGMPVDSGEERAK